MDDWRKWFDQTTGNAADSEIAAKVGVSRATVNRWRRKRAPDSATVLAIARAYEADPFQALIATGLVLPSDYTEKSMKYFLTAVPAPLLIEELHSRFLGKGPRGTLPFDLDTRETGHRR